MLNPIALLVGRPEKRQANHYRKHAWLWQVFSRTGNEDPWFDVRSVPEKGGAAAASA
jgi:hypothetical protein